MPKGVYLHHKRKTTGWNPEELEAKIKVILDTLSRIEAVPPALGSNWREGMIRYYSRVLAELEGYRNAGVQANLKSK